MTVSVDPIVIAQIDKARCPQCGDRVFVPSLRMPPDNPEDPFVWCRDMGHWEGRLSECDKGEYPAWVGARLQPVLVRFDSAARLQNGKTGMYTRTKEHGAVNEP